VALSEELEMVRDYLAIEEVRFGDRMRSRLTVDDAARSCLVPPLLLQPIVENAVKHGIAPSAQGGTVWVDARIEGEHLVLQVRDDGAGASGKAAAADTSGTGTGLTNVRERLAGLYGDRQRLETTVGSGGGTDVRLELPVSRENPPRA
jgi:LytS/YehU family sensor histidine kinase